MGPVAIVHDYVVDRAGSERVLLSMHHAFPDAPIHTAFFRPEQTFPEFRDAPIRPFAINRVRPLRHRHRAALPLLPTVFGRARIDADVVLCGTSGWSAGVGTRGHKVLYMHAPTRWLNDQDAFLAGRSRLERAGLRLLEGRLRRWDSRAVESGDRHLVPSSAMAETVQSIYGVDAEVLAPPVTIDPDAAARAPAPDVEPGFVLFAGRLVVNKNVATLLEAFAARTDDRLVIAGDGPELGRLRTLAPPNVNFVGAADDAGMRWLFRSCRSVVSASHESFGLITVEAASFGKPAAALHHGGFLDTVIDGVNGVFFERPEVDEICAALDRLDALDLDADQVRAHAARWSEAAFVARLRDIVAEVAR